MKLQLSLETSSEHGDDQIVGEPFGSSKTALSLETSSKKWDVGRAVLQHLFGALLKDPQGGPRGEIIENQFVFQYVCSKVSDSLETSSKHAFGRVFENVMS